MNQLKREVQKPVDDPEDQFLSVMLSFSIEAKERLEKVIASMDDYNATAARLASFFNESLTTTPTEELLAIFSDFVLAFEKAINDNEREKAHREQEKRLAERKAQRKAEQEAVRRYVIGSLSSPARTDRSLRRLARIGPHALPRRRECSTTLARRCVEVAAIPTKPCGRCAWPTCRWMRSERAIPARIATTPTQPSLSSSLSLSLSLFLSFHSLIPLSHSSIDIDSVLAINPPK